MARIVLSREAGEAHKGGVMSVAQGAGTSDPLAQAKQYLARVLPWADAGEAPAYVNICNTFQGEGYDKPAWGGRAVRSIDEAISYINFCLNKQTDTRDIYVCLSTQREPGEAKTARNGYTYYRANRNQPNAVALKSLFLDIDTKITKKDDKGYPTPDEAIKALAAFLKATGLPKPNVVVSSGGGFHVYWVMSRALTPTEWQPLACALAEATKQHGLKCDTGCTIDSARVMRIPNTFNRKTDPPLPVQLISISQNGDYSVDCLEQVLAPYKAAILVAPTSYLENPTLFPPRTGVQVENELGAGVPQYESPPINLEDVACECAFIRDALATGGATYGNPLWSLTTLIATFTDNPRTDAHRMANKHPGYTKESTDELFDRKLRDRAEKDIGWPFCKTISCSGCTACQACPHLAAGQSPLHLALPSKVMGSVPSRSFQDPYAEFSGPACPVNLLPPPLANFVAAEHQAMGADESALALAALTVVGGAIHAETKVQMGDSWNERPIIWAALVGPPSSMKSPIVDKATAPLRKIDNDRHASWEAMYTVWKQQSKSSGTAGPCPPKPQRKVIQDSTPEKIAELAARHDGGLTMVHDELAGYIGSFERYGSGAAARAFSLSSFNGGPYLKDRVGQGARDDNAEIRIKNLAVSVLGGIQPDRLVQIKDPTVDGLLQRFLLVSVRLPERGDETFPVKAAEDDYAQLIQDISQRRPCTYAFTADAGIVRRRVLDRLFELERVQGFSSAHISAIGKMKGYFGRLALTLHIADEQSAGVAGRQCVSAPLITKQTAEVVEKLLFEFFLPHLFGVYDVLGNGGKDRDTIRAIAGFILASDKERLRPSDFTAGVRRLRGQTHREIADWASRFCAMGWLQPEFDTAQLPAAWSVVPGLRDYFAERRLQEQRARAAAHAILSAGGARR